MEETDELSPFEIEILNVICGIANFELDIVINVYKDVLSFDKTIGIIKFARKYSLDPDIVIEMINDDEITMNL